jgi:hypothetical protein
MSSILETDIIQDGIRFRSRDHSYTHIETGVRLASVSEVISTVYAKKSWDGVSPEIVETAKIRGIAVDYWMTRYLREGSITIEGESYDVRDRVNVAVRIFESQFAGLQAETQKIVFSLDDLVAGMVDFWIDGRIVVDLKNTYSTEKGWLLQLGAYCTYVPQPVERCGVLHVSPKVYKQGGMWIEYDVELCRSYWRAAVEWWKLTRQFGKR